MGVQWIQRGLPSKDADALSSPAFIELVSQEIFAVTDVP